ncbi:hypothetical protein GTA08_BOTSDO12688 [Botryosphaeria dothidea]|uniref:Uncharacterized protein n=1 Tax=Botryosphaeria dothidea TaxID=55169 RepID=A0A8H4J2Y3_9PEZI|nr:hypothetical protein GTA08_BOTSDO12688 [Botryosphaeria dothidea]
MAQNSSRDNLRLFYTLEALKGADGQLRYDNQSKAEILTNQFFPPPRATDLSDLDGCIYPEPVEIPQGVTEEQVLHTIKKLPPDKAPGPDKIINRKRNQEDHQDHQDHQDPDNYEDKD